MEATRIAVFWRVDNREVCQQVLEISPRQRFKLQFPKPEMLKRAGYVGRDDANYPPSTYLEVTIIPLDLTDAELDVLRAPQGEVNQ
jgi:hypothetical protein